MIFAPKPLGNRKLAADELEKDKKKCRKIGPCGIGEKAVYLNSFFIDRHYYVTYTDIRRAYKQIAMSKGGFTGKGVFSTLPYLVVEFSNGLSRQCNFKYEEDVDTFLSLLAEQHPEIPVHSKAAEKKLRDEEEAERKRYAEHISESAQNAVKQLENAKEYLEKEPVLYNNLTVAAKDKRIVEHISPAARAVALVIFIAAAAAVAAGLYQVVYGARSVGLYMCLFGMAFMIFAASTRVLPSRTNNRKFMQKQWDEQVEAMRSFLKDDADFPVPAQYAHPVVLDRMIRVIREGRAESADEALQCLKEDLKALNSSVTVSRKEYDEVTLVKPLFLVSNYQ
jgi:hypothetical protein